MTQKCPRQLLGYWSAQLKDEHGFTLPKILSRYGCLNLNEWKLNKVKIQFLIAPATLQEFNSHTWRGLGSGGPWTAQVEGFPSVWKVCLQCGPRPETFLCPHTGMTFCPYLYCSTKHRYVRCPNVCLCPLQTEKNTEVKPALSFLWLYSIISQSKPERGILMWHPIEWSQKKNTVIVRIRSNGNLGKLGDIHTLFLKVLISHQATWPACLRNLGELRSPALSERELEIVRSSRWDLKPRHVDYMIFIKNLFIIKIVFKLVGGCISLLLLTLAN